MGSAESKVAVQPQQSLAVVVTATDGAGPRAAARPSTSFLSCNLRRKQNKTAPDTTRGSPPRQTSPRSSPTIEAVRDAKQSESSTGSTGPTAQLVSANKVVSLHQLSFEDLSTHLLKAVKNGDLKLVERIAEIATTKQFSIINIRGMWESTPLIYACQYCHEAIALWLLRAGADVRLVNEKGVTPLLLASLEGMVTAVEKILQFPTTGDALVIDSQVGMVYNSVADINVRANPLLAASMNGHADVVRLLLAAGASVNSGVATATGTANSSSSSGGRCSGSKQFPLLVAAKYGHSGVAQLLMEHGAAIANSDGNENHALLLACEAGKEECALALLRVFPESEQAAWKRANSHGFTALHYCAVHGLVRVVEFMLQQLQWKYDASFLNATSSTRHESAVLMASRKKQVEVVKLLLLCGADALLADRGATTALDVLKREKRDELVRLWQEQQETKAAEKTAAEIHDTAGTSVESLTQAQPESRTNNNETGDDPKTNGNAQTHERPSTPSSDVPTVQGSDESTEQLRLNCDPQKGPVVQIMKVASADEDNSIHTAAASCTASTTEATSSPEALLPQPQKDPPRQTVSGRARGKVQSQTLPIARTTDAPLSKPSPASSDSIEATPQRAEQEDERPPGAGSMVAPSSRDSTLPQDPPSNHGGGGDTAAAAASAVSDETCAPHSSTVLEPKRNDEVVVDDGSSSRPSVPVSSGVNHMSDAAAVTETNETDVDETRVVEDSTELPSPSSASRKDREKPHKKKKKKHHGQRKAVESAPHEDSLLIPLQPQPQREEESASVDHTQQEADDQNDLNDDF